ncbi:MAG: leucine-rich repeat protein [Bacteroidales bacterium]|jgi:hypothetical protein|nr:leucine-rich repeat protein [Bacteroidales bacterium]
MKIIRILFISLLFLSYCQESFAYDFAAINNGDTIYYNITSNVSPKSVEVTYKGANSYSGSISIPSLVTYNTVNYPVTKIGNQAFAFCSGLTSVSIPLSVIQIGDSAFCYCSNLSSINLPQSITDIGDSAFFHCSALTEISIPKFVKLIGNAAFQHNENLTTVYFNAINCFLAGSYSYPIFRDCPLLTKIHFDTNVTCIPHLLCFECSALSDTLILPHSVTKIGVASFNACSSLTTLIIPNAVDSIGQEAFLGCFSLASLSLGESVRYIGTNAFAGCYALSEIVIPNSVQTMGGGVFELCYGLINVSLPNSINRIENNLFRGCFNLSTITIPPSVTSIGSEAFSYCQNLQSITIPEHVTQIGNYAFESDTALKEINVKALTPPLIDTSAFIRISHTIPVYVPCQTEDAYQSADGWKIMSNIQDSLMLRFCLYVNDTAMGSIFHTPFSCAQPFTILTAVPTLGFRFVSWNDGNTDNPRHITLTQDTSLTAEFEYIDNILETDGKLSLQIYPNPAQDHIIIEQQQEDFIEITLYTAYGKKVKHTSTTKTQTKVLLDNLSNGMYIVKIRSSRENIVKKIQLIKQ